MVGAKRRTARECLTRVLGGERTDLREVRPSIEGSRPRVAFMHGFSEHQLIGAFLAIAGLLFATRGMAELCRRLGQPEVLGELLGGFLIGAVGAGRHRARAVYCAFF